MSGETDGGRSYPYEAPPVCFDHLDEILDFHKLAKVYHWFTEGFDTKDLQKAKALIEDLGEQAKRGNG